MKTIVILGGKLLVADNVLPVLVAIKELEPKFSPLIILKSEQDANLILNNSALVSGLDFLGAELRHFATLRGSSLQRLVVRFSNFLILRHMLLTKVVLFESVATRKTTVLHKINRALFGGRRVFVGVDNITDLVLERLQAEREGNISRVVQVFPDADAVIVSRAAAGTAAGKLIQTTTNTDLVEVGYSRGLPAWTKILDQETILVRREFGTSFIFFPLSVLFRSETDGGPPGGLHIDQLVIETLEVLDKFSDRLKIVMRYHPTTDRKRMAEIVRDLQLKNYAFTDRHPIALIRSARAVIMSGSSTLAFDAHYWGCPIIEYSHLNPIKERELGFKSRNEGIADFIIQNDKPRLSDVIDSLILRSRPEQADIQTQELWRSTDANLKSKILPLFS